MMNLQTGKIILLYDWSRFSLKRVFQNMFYLYKKKKIQFYHYLKSLKVKYSKQNKINNLFKLF